MTNDTLSWQSRLKEYLNELRIAYAAEQLENPDQSVSEIQRKSGFPNPNCFFTAFRRKFVSTPQEYSGVKRKSKKEK